MAYCTGKENEHNWRGFVKTSSNRIEKITCWDEYTKKIYQIPHSKDAVRKCIHGMSKDINKQVTLSIETSDQFSLQLNETSDICNDIQLMSFLLNKKKVVVLPFSNHGYHTRENIFN